MIKNDAWLCYKIFFTCFQMFLHYLMKYLLKSSIFVLATIEKYVILREKQGQALHVLICG